MLRSAYIRFSRRFSSSTAFIWLIIDARPAMTLGKERLEPRHLRVVQPEKVAHSSVSLRRLITPRAHDQWVLT